VRPGSSLLTRFIQLADAQDEEILNYALKWGVLEICEHLQPACHSDECRPQSVHDLFWEHTAVWRENAELFRSLLSIAARLESGKVGRQADWEIVIAVMRFEGSPAFAMHGLGADRQKLKTALNVLLTTSHVHPIVQDYRTGWQVELTGGFHIGSALFGALVCQLILAATRTEGAALCSACGAGFTPERRLNPERRAYCQTCRRRGVPARDAARDYRKRQRSSRSV